MDSPRRRQQQQQQQQQQRREQTAASASTGSVFEKPEGVRVGNIQPSGNLWGRNDQNKVILIVRHGGETEEKWLLF